MTKKFEIRTPQKARGGELFEHEKTDGPHGENGSPAPKGKTYKAARGGPRGKVGS